MAEIDSRPTPAKGVSPGLFALTIFTSAALVFMVQPMVAKLMLPLLGGSPSVWNTSMAFFQTALLAGYAYAHGLQRIGPLRIQGLVHVGVLALAALVLPLSVTGLLGEPSSSHPNLWLVGVLTLSIGAPFAVLSATAPLVQAWHARVFHAETGKEPYVLYAASNLGSLISLLAYPVLVEPLTTLHDQRLGWSLGYGAFVLIIGVLALRIARADGGAGAEAPPVPSTPRPSRRERLIWVALAAVPSSLMLGVTTHITTDVASAPFLWVIPLALYLVTFIIAFSDQPILRPDLTRVLQAAALAACCAILPFKGSDFAIQLVVHLAAFFLTALMCHQVLVSRRPDPAHLTEFYLYMSLGGVVGGGFNAFIAPVIFNNVWEYPLVLALSCLALPHGTGKLERWQWISITAGIAGGLAAMAFGGLAYWGRINTAIHIQGISGQDLMLLGVKLSLAVAMVMAFILRSRGLIFFGLIVLLSFSAEIVGDKMDIRTSWRSFFGVIRQSEMYVPGFAGKVKMLSHGTTLHGAQAINPDYDCRPLVYYAPETPIGQVFLQRRTSPAPLRIGVVGLGTGAVSAYTRKQDHLTFFEIDPLVIRISTDPKRFSYTTTCAEGKIDYVLGDARQTLARQPGDQFDILLIDAFSSDAVPAHLLTVEAIKGYLTKIKPDGVLILHLSNRNLELRSPAMAVAYAAGGESMVQRHSADPKNPMLWESSEDAVIVGRSEAALAAFAADKRWQPGDPISAKPWTDDYTNLVGALYAQLKEGWTWLP